MYLALGLAIAPLQREARFHGIVVSFQPTRKALEFPGALLVHAAEPLIEMFSLSLSQHGGELLDQFVGLGNVRISLTKLSQVLLLPLQALFFFTCDPMSYLRSRWRTLWRRFDRRFF